MADPQTLTSSIPSVYIIVGGIILFIAIYSTYQINLDTKNCNKINKYTSSTLITSIKKGDDVFDCCLNNVYVKTAYNCCCSGDFKNDYVNECALTFCAKEKVRALHFDIYSLNKRPVISTSTVAGNTYKETYNSLDMYTTMGTVSKLFTISSDPLFLIFNVNSKLNTTYESMYTILIEIFGTGNSTGNKIYFTNDLGNTKLSYLINKVVICIYAYDPTIYSASSLALISSLNLNGSSKIYRESDILDLLTSNQDPTYIPAYPQILFPNRQKSSNNYDFVTTGVKYGITFIGMSFQKDDNILKIYKKGFADKSKSFIKKTLLDNINNNVDTTHLEVVNYYRTYDIFNPVQV